MKRKRQGTAQWLRDPVWRLANGGWDDQLKDFTAAMLGKIWQTQQTHIWAASLGDFHRANVLRAHLESQNIHFTVVNEAHMDLITTFRHVPYSEDELVKINCGKVGRPGHHGCGFCTEHDMPRFKCGCLVGFK